jgi:uncharacterized membrane protein
MSLYFSQHEYIRKSADQQLTSTTTLVDDADLQFAIAPKEVWVATYYLRGSSATASIKFALAAPSGATVRYLVFSATGTTVGVTQIDTNGGTGTNQPNSNGATSSVTIQATVENGNVAGAVNLRWAQNTTSSLATIIKAGSFLVANRVA